MTKPEDNAHFHFVTVREKELVIRCMPCIIHTKRVSANFCCCNGLAYFEGFGPFPTRTKDGEGFGEDVVVDETCVY